MAVVIKMAHLSVSFLTYLWQRRRDGRAYCGLILVLLMVERLVIASWQPLPAQVCLTTYFQLVTMISR